MPIVRPPLPEIIDAVRADFSARLPGADVRSRRSPLDVFARVIGYIHHTLLGWLAWVSRQMLPDTAEADWMARHAEIWGIDRRRATYATGAITISGIPGAFIPEATIWRRGDGIQYVQDQATTISASGTAEAVVTAQLPGESGNTPGLTPLSIMASLTGVVSDALVSSFGIAAGADDETDDELRSRLLDHIREPPHGGSASDYKQWMMSITGVTRAWVFPLANGPGTVTIRFMMDGVYADGIPQPNDVAAVNTFVQTARPVTAEVVSAAPVAVPLDFSIRLIPDSSEVRLAVEAELRDLIVRETSPAGTLLISHIRESISTASGEVDHFLIAPTENITTDQAHITTFGSVIWT